MKFAISLFSLLTTSAALATTSRGYLSNANEVSFYAGLASDGAAVQYGLELFSDAQLQTMSICMLTKEQTAIVVVSDKLPAAVPGRYSVLHDIEIKSVSCERSPSFIEKWRKHFGAEPKDSN